MSKKITYCSSITNSSSVYLGHRGTSLKHICPDLLFGHYIKLFWGNSKTFSNPIEKHNLSCMGHVLGLPWVSNQLDMPDMAHYSDAWTQFLVLFWWNLQEMQNNRAQPINWLMFYIPNMSSTANLQSALWWTWDGWRVFLPYFLYFLNSY